MQISDIFLLILLWLIYFIIHSVLASLHIKKLLVQMLPPLARSYRIIYNILALILLFPIMYLTLAVPSPKLWEWPAGLDLIANAFAILALTGFAWSLKYYNNMDFLGFSQLKNEVSTQTHQFTLSPLHRYVRHPWYFFVLVIIWTRDMNVHFFVSTSCMTFYFFIGAIFEERKLVTEFGKVYSDYQKAVPCLIPSFRRFLSREQASDLLNKYSHTPN